MKKQRKHCMPEVAILTRAGKSSGRGPNTGT